MNYFNLLEIKTTFDLDLSQLEAAYLAAQRQYHPDRFATKPPEERARAAAISANLNEAYANLKNPLARAKHLLALSGITVLDEANSAKPDMALLAEIMELQEVIEGGQKPDIAALVSACETDLSHAFTKSDVHAAKTSTIRLSYLYKLGHQLGEHHGS